MYNFQDRLSVRTTLSGLADYDFGDNGSFEDFCDQVWEHAKKGALLGEPWTISESRVADLLAAYEA